MTVVPERLQTLLLARAGASKQPLSVNEFAKALRRFAPGTATDREWLDIVERELERARQAGLLDDARRPRNTDVLRATLGKQADAPWPRIADRVLPLVALGVPADDARVATRLKDRDTWTAAIAGRLLGLWTDGPPPSLPAVCDALAWKQLGLPGRPKRCPPEIRSLFLQRELHAEMAPPDRLLRLYVAKALEAPRPELRVVRDATVRCWLTGRPVGPNGQPTASPDVRPAASFARDVRSAARTAREGVFGERKVFISSVWNDLRRHPTWSSLSLDEFKRQLVAAHRRGDVVLARADLVAAMNPELVAASEIQADGASFHFIVREDAP